jgi:hypothetical protein
MQEGGSHILRCDGTRNWRDRWLENKFTRIREIGITRLASNKIKDIWPKIGQCLIKYKEKWKRVVKSDE